MGTIRVKNNRVDVFGPIVVERHRGGARRLKVFLCHYSGDKESVRDLYEQLHSEKIDAWLDEEDLIPGQDWELEIRKAIRVSDAVIVCLSKNAVSRAGFVQKEIRFALDIADEQPEGVIFIIPLKLEQCDVPDRLKKWQWLDYAHEGGYGQLLRALEKRTAELGGVTT